MSDVLHMQFDASGNVGKYILETASCHGEFIPSPSPTSYALDCDANYFLAREAGVPTPIDSLEKAVAVVRYFAKLDLGQFTYRLRGIDVDCLAPQQREWEL